jgi:hypothetical protein
MMRTRRLAVRAANSLAASLGYVGTLRGMTQICLSLNAYGGLLEFMPLWNAGPAWDLLRSDEASSSLCPSIHLLSQVCLDGSCKNTSVFGGLRGRLFCGRYENICWDERKISHLSLSTDEGGKKRHCLLFAADAVAHLGAWTRSLYDVIWRICLATACFRAGPPALGTGTY